MKIKTLEDLQEKLDSDLGWRRIELTAIYNNIQKSTLPKTKTELRIGIVMLYAHWEGFIRNISQYYLTYVCQKHLRFEELEDNFVALELKRILEKNESKTDFNIETVAVKFIRENLSLRSNIKLDIETKSNLNSDVFQEILLKLGLDYSRFSMKEKLIDEKLLKNRNSIAHGNYLDIDKDDYEVLYSEIIGIMNELKNLITNCATLKTYKKKMQ